MLRQSCVQRCLANISLSIFNLTVARGLYIHLTIADIASCEYPIVDLTCWISLYRREQLRANLDLMILHIQVSIAPMRLLLVHAILILILYLLLSSI